MVTSKGTCTHRICPTCYLNTFLAEACFLLSSISSVSASELGQVHYKVSASQAALVKTGLQPYLCRFWKQWRTQDFLPAGANMVYHNLFFINNNKRKKLAAMVDQPYPSYQPTIILFLLFSIKCFIKFINGECCSTKNEVNHVHEYLGVDGLT